MLDVGSTPLTADDVVISDVRLPACDIGKIYPDREGTEQYTVQ